MPPTKKKTGPTTSELATAAIVTLKERGGSSLPAIKKAIAATGATVNNKLLNTALKNAKKFTKVKGSFKVVPAPKPKKKKAKKKKAPKKKKVTHASSALRSRLFCQLRTPGRHSACADRLTRRANPTGQEEEEGQEEGDQEEDQEEGHQEEDGQEEAGQEEDDQEEEEGRRRAQEVEASTTWRRRLTSLRKSRRRLHPLAFLKATRHTALSHRHNSPPSALLQYCY